MIAMDIKEAVLMSKDEQFINHMIESLNKEECFKDLVIKIRHDEEYNEVFKTVLTQICVLIHLYEIEYLNVNIDESLLCEFITKIITIPVETENENNYKDLLNKLNNPENMSKIFFETILLSGVESFQNDLFNSIIEKMNISEEDINDQEKFSQITAKITKDINSKAPMFKSKILSDIVKEKDVNLMFLEFAKYLNRLNIDTLENLDIKKYQELIIKSRIKLITDALFGEERNTEEEYRENHI